MQYKTEKCKLCYALTSLCQTHFRRHGDCEAALMQLRLKTMLNDSFCIDYYLFKQTNAVWVMMFSDVFGCNF